LPRLQKVMFLTVAAARTPATDLGFLLMKPPDRAHEIELAFDKAVVFFPEANQECCEAPLVLDRDPAALVRDLSSMAAARVDSEPVRPQA